MKRERRLSGSRVTCGSCSYQVSSALSLSGKNADTRLGSVPSRLHPWSKYSRQFASIRASSFYLLLSSFICGCPSGGDFPLPSLQPSHRVKNPSHPSPPPPNPLSPPCL